MPILNLRPYANTTSSHNPKETSGEESEKEIAQPRKRRRVHDSDDEGSGDGVKGVWKDKHDEEGDKGEEGEREHDDGESGNEESGTNSD